MIKGEFNMNNEKMNWLPVKVISFKESGKYNTTLELSLPNDCSFYHRRATLTKELLDIYGKTNLTFVSLDTSVLGWPYMNKPLE